MKVGLSVLVRAILTIGNRPMDLHSFDLMRKKAPASLVAQGMTFSDANAAALDGGLLDVRLLRQVLYRLEGFEDTEILEEQTREEKRR